MVDPVHEQHLWASIPLAHHDGTGGCRLLRRCPMVSHMDRLPKRYDPFDHVQGVVVEGAGDHRGNGFRLITGVFAA
jgi:hypothetical protein